MDFESIRLKYIEHQTNPHICLCKDKTISLSEFEISLKNKNDNIAKCIIACYYLYNNNDDEARKFITEAINDGCIYAHNIYGYMLDRDNDPKCIYFYKMAADNKICHAYRNLGIYYLENIDHNLAKKYLKYGIRNDVLCCKVIYAKYYLKNESTYYYLMHDYASDGCLEAFNILKESKNYSDETLMKIAKKYLFHDFICEIIDKTEKENRYMYIKLIKEFENSDNSHISFHISKKYINSIETERGRDLLFYSIEKGCNPAFSYFLENPGCMPFKHKNIFFRKLSTIKLDTLQKVNIAYLCYINNECNKLNDYFYDISEEHYKLLIEYLLLDHNKNHRAALNRLQQAYDICPENEKNIIVGKLGIYHYNYGDKNKGIELLMIGSQKYKDIISSIYLTDIYLLLNKLDEAIPYIIELCKKKKLYSCETVIKKMYGAKFNIEQFRTLINGNVSFAILLLFKQNLNASVIEDICKDFLHDIGHSSSCKRFFT